MRHLHRTILLIIVVYLGATVGCTSDESSKQDAGAGELERCTLKVRACVNTCMEADLGSKCITCCERNGASCDTGNDYSFYSCPNK